MVNEGEVEDPNAQPDEEYVYTIDHEVSVVDLSPSGCEVNKIREKENSQGMGPKNPRTNSQGTQEPKNKQPWNTTQEQTAREWDPRTHESLMMVDSGASVNVCPKLLGNSKLEKSDDAT